MTWREVRDAEKARYIAANPNLPDTAQRWRKYEDLILDKFGPGPVSQYPPLRRIQALDQAWARRDKWNSRASKRNNTVAPINFNGLNPQ